MDELSELFDALFGADPNKFKDGEWVTKKFTNEDGSYKSTIMYRYGAGGGANVNPTERDLKGLKKALEVAVENEDFEKAIEIRNRMKSLEENQDKIKKLTSDMKQAVDNMDFERAIEIREELNKLKS